jgi:hypothetical protein
MIAQAGKPRREDVGLPDFDQAQDVSYNGQRVKISPL